MVWQDYRCPKCKAQLHKAKAGAKRECMLCKTEMEAIPFKAISHVCERCGAEKDGFNDEIRVCQDCACEMEHSYRKSNGGRWFHRDNKQTKGRKS